MIALQVIFWLLIFSMIYSMSLYPLLMWALSRVWRVRLKREPITPKVSQIIAAYNEEKAIAAKLENSLAFDYPKEKLEVIVVSDGSTDRTDEIVRSFADRGVKLVRVEGLGKTLALNEAVRHATGEVFAFSDATGLWSADAIRRFAEHFADPRVGCVSGRVAYRYDESLTAKGFGVYQRFVTALRSAEGAFAAGFNAPGSIHAVRAAAFLPGPPDTFMDMVDPFHMAIQGLRTTHEHDAVSWEESRTTIKDEFKARLRINMRAWTFMFYALRRFPIFKSPMYCFSLVSHKFLRWTIGPFLFCVFVINLFLLREHWIYQVTMAGQIAYHGLTLIGWVLGRLGKPVRGLGGLVFFNSVNFAYALTLLRFLRGERVRRWVPSR